MYKASATEIKNRFGEFLEKAQERASQHRKNRT